jgi:Na+/melibiose symporter-like transporter
MFNFLSKTPTRILVLICALGFFAIFAMMQFLVGPALSLSRGTSGGLMAAMQLLFIFAIFMPRLSRAVGKEKALFLFAILVVVAAGMTLYFVNVRIPAAIMQTK